MRTSKNFSIPFQLLSLILITTTLFSSISIYAQTCNNNQIELLRHIDILIKNSSYDEALDLVNNNIKINTPDSIKAELYYRKFRTISKKDLTNNHEAKESLLMAIAISEKLGCNRNKRLYDFYKKFLSYDLNRTNEKRDITVKLFKNRFYYAKDYHYLISYYFAPECCDIESDELRLQRIDSLSIELQKQGAIPEYFWTYNKFIKAKILSEELRTYYSDYRDRNSIRKALLLYDKCLKDYYYYKHCEPVDYLTASCLYEMARLYANLRMFDVAAIYQKRYLDILQKRWQLWGLNSPWSHHEIRMTNPFSSYTDYMMYLELSTQYDKGIEYSKWVFNEINKSKIYNNREMVDSFSEKILSTTEEFKYLTTNSTKHDFLSNKWDDNRLSSLYEGHKFKELSQLTDSIIRIHSNRYTNIENNYIASYFEDNSIKSTKDEDVLFAKRMDYYDEFHEYVNALRYRGRIASYKGNSEIALKCQQEVIDIIKIDNKFSPNKRDDLLNGDFNSNSYIYLGTEISDYLCLSWYYIENNRNKEALYCLDRALRTITDIISTSRLGNNEFQYNIFQKEIERLLLSAINTAFTYKDKCPEIADYVIKLFSLTKGAVVNDKRCFKNALQDYLQTHKNDKRTYNQYKEMIDLDRKIDLTYYTNNESERENLTIERAICQIQIDLEIDLREIYLSSIIDKSKLDNLLQPNDLYLDIVGFSDGTDDDTFAIAYMVSDNKAVARAITKTTYYAVAYKTEWEHARIIRVCDNYSRMHPSLGTIAHYMFDINAQRAYKFYTSPMATNYIWNNIIRETNVTEGTNIYFIPNGDFNKIAIEQMQIDSSGQRICDRYNFYRLTSSYEINRKIKPYNSNNTAAIFYNLDYKWVNSAQIPNYLMNNLVKPNDKAILNSMYKVFAQNLKQYSSDSGTENNLASMSQHSPAYLHISTHGFNIESINNKDDLTYFIGNRNIFLNKADTSMYTTGLYMSSSVKNNSTSNDGLLTSHEISLLDLSDTKLCVLSACSTASGKSTFDGIFGLQRAFKLAGVKTLIVSIWDVDSKATELLMSRFYEYLANHTPRIALQKAQFDVKNYTSEEDSINGLKHRYENPYYWAGFLVLDGNE